MNLIPKTIIDLMVDLAIMGALLVSFGYPLAANIVWTITNPYLIWYNWKMKQPEQMKMFIVYSAISLFGIWNLWGSGL